MTEEAVLGKGDLKYHFSAPKSAEEETDSAMGDSEEEAVAVAE